MNNQKDKYFYICYFMFSAIFMASAVLRPYPLSWLVKAIPAWTMGILLLSKGGKVSKFMGVGFFFSSLGDIFLDLDRSGFFVHGLASFLIAHLFYAYCFSTGFVFRKKRLLLAGLIVIHALTLSSQLLPKLGNLTVPVLAYVLCIVAMGVSASFWKSEKWWTGLGALIFVLSDSLIAVNKFLVPLSWSPLAIMITYYIGHFLMGYGMIKTLSEFKECPAS